MPNNYCIINTECKINKAVIYEKKEGKFNLIDFKKLKEKQKKYLNEIVKFINLFYEKVDGYYKYKKIRIINKMLDNLLNQDNSKVLEEEKEIINNENEEKWEESDIMKNLLIDNGYYFVVYHPLHPNVSIKILI